MNYMLIDTTETEKIRVVLVAPLHAVQLHGRILEAQGRKVVAPPIEGRGFSKFSQLELQYLWWNHTGQRPSDDYATQLNALLEMVQALPVDETPEAELEAEFRRLCPDEVVGGKSTQAKEPKPVRNPGEPPTAPKAGSTTGKVWEIADRVCPAGAAIDRNAIIAACKEAGINEATAATQYSKWKRAREASK